MGLELKWQCVRGANTPTTVFDLRRHHERIYREEMMTKFAFPASVMSARRLGWAFIAHVNVWLPDHLQVKVNDRELAFDRVGDSMIALDLMAHRYGCTTRLDYWVLHIGRFDVIQSMKDDEGGFYGQENV